MTKPAAHRYAVYYAPAPDSPWWAAGSQWLGRCATQHKRLPQPTVPGLTAAEFSALTAAPRRYGWHATLKAPFALAEGISLAALRAALQELSWSLSAFAMPPLRVARLDDFLALVPQGSADRLQAVASACVTELDALAAPLGAAELQRRRQAQLTPEQDKMLVRWGYPYVLEHFRFHCSLTGPVNGLEPAQIDAVQEAAESLFHNLPPIRFDTLALFAEPAPGADFLLLDHFSLRP
jgi:putative phosphonate metabolism protein